MSRLTALLPLSLVLATALTACSSTSAPPAKDAAKVETKDARPVETARVEQGELTARYAATATLQAEHEAKLISEVPGTVLDLLVEEGDAVRKGQLLARIDAAHSRQQLREAYYSETACTLGGDVDFAEKVCRVVEKAHGIKGGQHGTE